MPENRRCGTKKEKRSFPEDAEAFPPEAAKEKGGQINLYPS